MGRIMVVLFADGEEDVYQQIMQIMNDSNGFERCDMVQETENIQIGELKIDLQKRCVTVENREVILTNREFDILYLLAKNPGRVFSKEQIYDIVWQEPYSGDYNIVMSHIRHIREKIEDNPSAPRIILTVRGMGYRLGEEDAS